MGRLGFADIILWLSCCFFPVRLSSLPYRLFWRACLTHHVHGNARLGFQFERTGHGNTKVISVSKMNTKFKWNLNWLTNAVWSQPLNHALTGDWNHMADFLKCRLLGPVWGLIHQTPQVRLRSPTFCKVLLVLLVVKVLESIRLDNSFVLDGFDTSLWTHRMCQMPVWAPF